MKELLVKYHRDILNSILTFAKRLLFKPLKPKKFDKIQRVLIFRNGSIGDSICAMPALSVIRDNFKHAELDLLTNSGGHELVSMDQIIDDQFFNTIINYFGVKWIKLYSFLKNKNYDLFIELPQSKSGVMVQLRNQVIASMLWIPHGFGWSISRTLIFPKWQEKHGSFMNERDRLVGILKSNQLNVNKPGFMLGITEKNSQNVISEFEKLNLLDKKNNIGLVIGANRKRNRWPIEYFKEVADHYIGKGYNILVFGGPQDELLFKTFNNDNPRLFSFCNKFTVMESAEAFKKCAVVITNDTGPMHLAYSVDTPVIALFSSRNFPGEWDPPINGKNHSIRTPDVECSICYKRKCKINTCMKMISPDRVITLCDDVLTAL